jgi:hypothetical protein
MTSYTTNNYDGTGKKEKKSLFTPGGALEEYTVYFY